MIAAVYARILLATFCLLAAATSAAGECAWVLWATTLSVPKDRPTPMAAFQTKADCEQEAQKMKRDLSDVNRELKTGILMAYTCLPDTVDPRGPKGK